jgi:hypothetical protein
MRTTKDSAIALRWAAEAGISLHAISNAVKGGGRDMAGLWQGRGLTDYVLVVAWWGFADAADNGFAACRCSDEASVKAFADVVCEMTISGLEGAS